MAYDSSTDYALVVSACRDAIRKGTFPNSGDFLRRVIDVVQHAANTLDSVGAATAVTAGEDAEALELLLVDLAAAAVASEAAEDALEASLVTHIANWVAVGAGDSEAVRATAITAWGGLRTTVTSAGTALIAANTACVTPRADLVTSAAAAVAAAPATITNITTSTMLDGRSS